MARLTDCYRCAYHTPVGGNRFWEGVKPVVVQGGFIAIGGGDCGLVHVISLSR